MVMHQDINTAKNIDYSIWTQDTSIFLQGFQVFCACSPVTRMHVVVDAWIQPTMRLCKESENFKWEHAHMLFLFTEMHYACPLYAAHHDTNLPFARAFGETIIALQGAENASYTMYELEH